MFFAFQLAQTTVRQNKCKKTFGKLHFKVKISFVYRIFWKWRENFEYFGKKVNRQHRNRKKLTGNQTYLFQNWIFKLLNLQLAILSSIAFSEDPLMIYPMYSNAVIALKWRFYQNYTAQIQQISIQIKILHLQNL